MPQQSARRQERERFQYRPRTMEDVKEQTDQQGGNFDSIFKSNIDQFKPQDGENVIRYCPPTWPDARSYSYEIWVHYNVGPRSGTYLCPRLMLNKRCPICEAEADALQHGEKADADALKAKKRKVAWVIDRNSNSSWPCLWSFGWTLDRDLGALLTDRKGGTVLQVDHPNKGFDVSFQKQGGGKDPKNTKYFGFVVDREASYMLNDEREQDEVINFLQDNPLPDMLKFYDADYLEELVAGTAGEDDGDNYDDYDNDNREDDDMVARARSARGGGGGRDRDDAPRGRGGGREEARRGGRRDDPPEDDRDTRRGRDRDDDRGRGRDDDRDERERDRVEAASRGRGRDRDDDRGRDRDDPPPRGRGRDRDDDRGDTRRGRGRDDPPEDDDLPFDADGDENYDADGDPETGADDAGEDAPRGRGGGRDADRDEDRPRTARGGGGARGGRNGSSRGAADERDDDRGASRSSRRPPPREQGRRAAPRRGR